MIQFQIKWHLKVLVCLAVTVLLFGCAQISVHEDLERIQKGMDKSEVIDILGGPQRSDRHRGQDEWSYIFCQDHKRMIGQVRFEEGKVIEVVKPVSSTLFNKLQKSSNPEEYEKALELHRKESEAGDSCR